MLKTDSAGNPLWFKTYGNTFLEAGEDVIQTSDKGMLLQEAQTVMALVQMTHSY
ncbi:MAG: hypothetical protein IPN61_10920 [Bacteroidetes bacterium]|nr:hypothetical protein [Bacteroidota bacterium]